MVALSTIQPFLALATADAAVQVVQLSMPDLRYEHSPVILKTGSLGMEVAIGVYDPESQSGLMATSPHFMGKHLEHLKEVVGGLFDDSNRLSVYVFGGAYPPSKGLTRGARDLRSRVFLQKRLQLEHSLMAFFDNGPIDFHWLESGTYGSLSLKTETGEFTIYKDTKFSKSLSPTA